MTRRESDIFGFGGFLRQLRKKRNIGFDEFRNSLGVSKAYLNDVETGQCRPPTPEAQIKMYHILCAAGEMTQEETIRFYSLAAIGRGELPADVALFLSSDGGAVDEIRNSFGYNEFWQKYGK